MSKAFFYVDESGDLGWTLHHPYRHGGSSQYLTLAALVVLDNLEHYPPRVIKRLYDKYKWKTARERKWVDLKDGARLDFAKQAVALVTKHDDIKYFSITVKKENVQPHIRGDSNKLYNYMIRLLLVEQMAKYDFVTFVPDARSIKVRSGNSLHDYLQIALWFEIGATTQVKTRHTDSSSNRNVQFTDMLAGLVQSYFEDGQSQPWKLLQPHITSKKLFF